MVLPNSSRIPFNRPCFVGNEQQYIAEAIANGHISGDGAFTRACQTLLEQAIGAPKVFLTTSCTHALEMSALMLDLGPGDEILMPSFTFVSTANAFVLRRAKPVFVDVRRDTLNIDERQVEQLITPRTRAIVPVHYAGVACEMDALTSIAKKHGLAIIEDNAHGLFGTYKGKPLGSFGTFATQSFHETKNFTCGEGGAFVINDSSFIERAEILREKGTNRARFFRGMVDKYTWVSEGSSYLPSDMLAGFLLAQLEARERVQARRQAIWQRYYDGLSRWANEGGVGLPFVPEECGQSYHMFYLLLPDTTTRDALIAYLRERNIIAVFHYVPLHDSEMGRQVNPQNPDCPVTRSVSERLVRLPFYNDMSQDDQDRLIAAVQSF